MIAKFVDMGNFNQALDNVFDEVGFPDALISLPLGALPNNPGNWQALPTWNDFNAFIEKHITNHFLVSQRGSLIDACKVFFLTHPLLPNSTDIAKAFAQLAQTALAPVCVTAAQEAARLTHRAVFYQMDDGLNSSFETYQQRLIDALLTLSVLKYDPKTQSKEKFPLQSGALLII